MSNGINKVTLVGNLGADVELRFTPDAKPVTDLRVATNRSYTNGGGDKVTETEWHRVVVWGKQAESCAKYLAKGRQVYVEGRLKTRSWEDKDGVKRFTTEIVASSVQFLGSSSSERTEKEPAPAQAELPLTTDDEVPY